MNYTCVCVGGFLIIELCWWLVAGKQFTKTMQKAKEDGTFGVAHAVVVEIDDGKRV
jgi:choline transport protein